RNIRVTVTTHVLGTVGYLEMQMYPTNRRKHV
ncbi:MAG: hypothetical protein RL378_22, partial [Actinomycetota bacterium]